MLLVRYYGRSATALATPWSASDGECDFIWHVAIAYYTHTHTYTYTYTYTQLMLTQAA